jgi:hypothetical protein
MYSWEHGISHTNLYVIVLRVESCAENGGELIEYVLLYSIIIFIFISCVPQKTHSQQAMTKVKYVLVPDVK